MYAHMHNHMPWGHIGTYVLFFILHSTDNIDDDYYRVDSREFNP